MRRMKEKEREREKKLFLFNSWCVTIEGRSKNKMEILMHASMYMYDVCMYNMYL